MKHLFTALAVLLSAALQAQKNASPQAAAQPKLVVGIVVDQMRQDYIYRYWDRFGEGGFKRLINQGYFYRNMQYNYVPTYTGPGHASIYTGTTPAVHGIISNDWYLKHEDRYIYCTEDKTVTSVGSSGKEGQMSPRNMLSTTIGDELKLATMQRSKVFAVSLKDRASILPGGHTANGAFWFEGGGSFISSSYYMHALPQWLVDFNAQQLPKKYLAQGWKPMYAMESYTNSTADQNAYEGPLGKNEKVTFPYSYEKQLEKGSYGIIRSTPFGNSLTKDMAIACLKGEQLGKHDVTDMLCISFSSTDYIAHYFGPRSIETEDVYLRLDKDLEELLNTLDKEVGRNGYIVFLTADHGGCDVPHYLEDLKIPAGYIDEKAMSTQLKTFCKQQFGDSLIRSYSNQQVFLDEVFLQGKGLRKADVERAIGDYALSLPGIAEAYPSDVLKYGSYGSDFFKYLIQKGYNHVRSGNLAISYNPGWMETMSYSATTHGASYSYDTHVPLIFYGMNIPKGSSVEKAEIADIAPTLSMLLNISFPNGCSGKPLKEVIVR